MGQKISAVHGVKSGDFYKQGNAINEIWVGDVELISRLPFGDSDLGQAGWPRGSWPKIPWHQFIIPLKREVTPDTMTAVGTISNIGPSSCPYDLPRTGYFAMYNSWPDWLSLLFGMLMLPLGFWLCIRVWKKAAARRCAFRHLLDPLVRNRDHVEQPILIRTSDWLYIIHFVFSFLAGVHLVTISVPALTMHLRKMSASVWLATWVLCLTTICGTVIIYQVIRLTWEMRCVMAKYENSLRAEEETAQAVIFAQSVPATTAAELKE